MSELTIAGIYPPLPTFFTAEEELDLKTLQHHIQQLKDTGLAGYVALGSNGEAVHLTSEERARVIEAVRVAAGESALLMVGCGDQSTRTTLAHCRLAAENGADIALILPPFYYKSRMKHDALLAHYRAVADQSPLPLLIYNMPNNTGGLDLGAELVLELAQHPRILGIKDSAGDIPKLAQIVAQAPAGFKVMAGSAGYLLPALQVGAVGAISALANIFPREVCHLQALFTSKALDEAERLQARLKPANTAVTATYSVAGLKAALEMIHGYGGVPRSPLLPLNDEESRYLSEVLQDLQLPILD